jgi:hypothetical protein
MSTVIADLAVSSSTEPDSVTVESVRTARVVRSEWIKMRSLRSTALTLLTAVVTMVATGWIFGWASNTYWADMRPNEQLAFSPIDASLAGYNLAQLAVGVLGVLLVTGEYATGMIRATFGAVPQRLPILWAKAVVYAGVTFALMFTAAIVAFLGGQHLLGEHGTTLTAPGALRSIMGVAGYLLVVPSLGLLLPSSWQRNLLPYLPNNAGGSLFSVRTAEDALSATTSLQVLVVWVAAALTSAALFLKRRDA